MRRFFVLMAVLALGCGDDRPVSGDTDFRCFALDACTEEIAAAAAQAGARATELGLENSHPAFTGTVEGTGHAGVLLRDALGDPVLFRLPFLPSDFFEQGETVEYLYDGNWQVVRGETRAVAALIVQGDRPPDGIVAMPGEGPQVSFVESCKVEGGIAVALEATHGDISRRIEPGQAAQLDEWRLVHQGGLWAAAPGGGDGGAGGDDPGAGGAPGKEGDPGDGCVQRRAMAQPLHFQLAAVATWQARTTPWCEPAAVEEVEGLAWSALFGAGIHLEDGGRLEGRATGQVVALMDDRVFIDLDDGRSANFSWLGSLPAAPMLGERVELVDAWPWAELHGSVRLGLLQDSGFVASHDLPPAFGEMEIGWVPGCAFREPIGDFDCGGPDWDATVNHLRIDDETIIGPGQTTTVEGIEIGLVGAIQYPSHSNESCVAEAMFHGVATAVDRSPER